MNEPVIVATARTPVGKAFRGSFNKTHAVTLAAHALRHAVDRSNVAPEEIDDIIAGCGMPLGVAGGNIARNAAIRAGLPNTVGGATTARFCASGLQALASAAQHIATGGADVMATVGVESISMVRPVAQKTLVEDDWLSEHRPDVYMTMIETAEVVSRRYGISREAQDEYSLQSQLRTAAAQQAGRFDDEIVPLETVKSVVVDKATGETRDEPSCIDRDEGNRPQTTLDALQSLPAVMGDGNFITAGNASQLSDGAAALVLTSADYARDKGLEAMGTFKGYAVAGVRPDEMGVGPIFAVRKLLDRAGLSVADIDLWELNEAFACQVIHCRDELGIPDDLLNVNGGGIALGHPFGMTGARQAGHILIEGKRRGAKYAVSTMCVAGGMGAAALYEIAHH